MSRHLETFYIFYQFRWLISLFFISFKVFIFRCRRPSVANIVQFFFSTSDFSTNILSLIQIYFRSFYVANSNTAILTHVQWVGNTVCQTGRTEPFCISLTLLRFTLVCAPIIVVSLRSRRLRQNGSVRPFLTYGTTSL
jgi:hypothetical protein